MVIVTLLVTTLVAFEVNTLDSPRASTSQPVGGVSSVGSNGLQLSASLNASRLTPGQTLQVNVSIFNTLSTFSNVTISNGWPFEVDRVTASPWPFQGVPLGLWPDDFYTTVDTNASSLAEAVVLKGDYTIANISSVANTHPIVRVGTEGMWVDYAVFEPSSSQANFTGYYLAPKGGNMTLGPYHVANTFTTKGYWNLLNDPYLGYGQQQAGLSPIAIPFAPGVYTVGIDDVWGQWVILHFEVT